ncbi:CoA-binding protein [bacterium]|nr:CoA-binding protein [bacterium]MBU1651922.1 CoA-binding protein [bacterium]MBU1880874.1 CoA-binding protein [bacterium]
MASGRQNNPGWTSDSLIDEILDKVKTIAVVGISDKASRPSAGVAMTLLNAGYEVCGVNPKLTAAMGINCYPDLKSIPKKIDLVDVFRRPEAIDPIVDAVIDLKIPYLWMQLGVINPDAAHRVADAGIKVIMDRCMAVELSVRGR